MVAIIDYGVGNLFSLKSSFAKIEQEAVVTGDPAKIADADRLILPGVGAFGDAADKLRETGLSDIVKKECAKGKPLMGICLGMQLLFEKSYEYGEHEGLGLIKGEVVSISNFIPAEYKIPQIGWNALKFTQKKCPIFKYTKEGTYVYFVHSFAGTNCEDSLIATCEYGADLTACVADENVIGCQFHPEKSGDLGLLILKAFCEM